MENVKSKSQIIESVRSASVSGRHVISKSERLLSLDVFRGITIAGMILVNNPGSWGSIYPALEHAKWNGATPTDLIFPFFLFIVGVAITFSLGKKKATGEPQTKLIFQILKRSAILFLLGLNSEWISEL